MSTGNSCETTKGAPLVLEIHVAASKEIGEITGSAGTTIVRSETCLVKTVGSERETGHRTSELHRG